MRLRSLFLLASLALPIAPAVADDDPFKDTTIESTELGSGVWMLTGRGGNMLLVTGAGGALLVDDQFAPLTERIQAAIGGLTQEPLKFVVNTHWHGDHTGGNENLGAAGAVIVAHEGVHRRMSTDQVMELWNREVPAAPMVARPVVTFTEGVTLHLAERPVEVMGVGAPAHTDGDSFVKLADANVLHMGDTFFHGFYPFIDVGSGGSLDGVIAAADRALTMADDATKIVPGHGPVATKAALEAYRAMLVGVRAAIAPLVAAGKTRDEVIAAKPTAAFDAVWGGGFMSPDDFTGIVVDGMAAGR